MKQAKGKGEKIRKPKPPDCRRCVIRSLNDVVFANIRQGALFQVRENVANFRITATPSIPGCPCQWDNRVNVEFVDIRTGLANQTRAQILRTPQLIRTRPVRIDRNAGFFTIMGCQIDIKVSAINQALRRGQVAGLPFNLKGIVLRLGLRVRCGRVFRRMIVQVLD